MISCQDAGAIFLKETQVLENMHSKKHWVKNNPIWANVGGVR